MLQKDYYAAVNDYNEAVISGIVKIASKMGISTIQSYQGSMIFEAIGLKPEFIEKYFTGTVSRVGGIGLEEIAKDYMARHSEAFDPLGLSVDLTLNSVGQHKSKSGGESICTTRERSICSSSLQGAGIMKCSSSTRRWLMKNPKESHSVDRWTSIIQRKEFRFQK